MWLLLALACTESSILPEDPSVTGFPVGVRTVAVDELTVEIWYPASDDHQDEQGERLKLADWAGDVVIEHLGNPPAPELDTIAVRDAAIRDTGAAFPVVIFSHGFAGFRSQSVTLTTHLASRGYVVLSADHSGRMVGDLLPCLFDPFLDGCKPPLGDEDPAVDHVDTLADFAVRWPADDPLMPFVDADHLGLIGHSAGGGTTGEAGSADERFDALVPMAMGPEVSRDVPTLVLAGDCDAVVPLEDVRPGVQASFNSTLLVHEGAGHHVFSDICPLGLADWAEEYLLPRDDLREAFAGPLLTLANDGCAGTVPDTTLDGCDVDTFRPVEDVFPEVNGLVTSFLDLHLKGEGSGADPSAWPGVVALP